METKILEEKKNALFSRKEIKLEVRTDVVPSNKEAVEIVCNKFSCDAGVVRIRKIDSRFGSQAFVIIADVYDSVAEFNRVVRKTKQEVEAEKKAEEEKIKAEAEAKKAKEDAKIAAEEAKAAAKAEKEKPVEEVKEAEGKAEGKEKKEGENQNE